MGQNTLVLTALDNAQDGPGDSGLAYDALTLTDNPAQKSSSTPGMSAQPSIYYVQKNGGLDEMTRVTVTLPARAQRGSVRLTIGKQDYTAQLSSSPGFGEQRFMFPVPEWSGTEPATLMLRVNGKTYRQSVSLLAKRKWSLYLVPHEHLDVGFTDYRGKVAEVHDRNIDGLLTDLAAHPQMRWSIDGSWIAQHYLATRKPAAQQEFLRLVREGKIGVPAEYANLLTGYASLEELIRSTFYTYSLHQKAGIPFDYANITDVPSYTWSYPSILHALGIRYFAAASNNDRAPILLWGRWNTLSPFWWAGPDGSKVLMSYSRQYSQLAFLCQLPPQMAACAESLPVFLQSYETPSYKPDAALIYGSQVENTDILPGTTAFVKEWNAQHAYPKFILSTFPDYFRYIDGRFGIELPTITGDGGPYWEDGVGTDARTVAIGRIAQQRALSAEKLSTLGAYTQKDVAGEQGLIRQMWQNLILFSEHTFTSWGGYDRPHSDESRRQQFTKNQFVMNARQEINSIVDQSMSQIADQIRIPAPAIVVFNPLSWRRSGLVETDLDDGMEIKEYPSMEIVPYEVLRRGNGYNRIRFMALNVPAMGYQCYAMAPAPSKAASAPADAGALPLSNTLENAYYRVRFDPASGALSSIYDKQLGKELVNTAAPYHMNQYLYVSGGEGTQIVYLDKMRPEAKLAITPSGAGRVTSIRKTPYGLIMTYETQGLEAPRITVNVMLFDHQKKIEFVDHIQKQPVTRKEAVYFAFPFAIAHPEFDYEIQNGWVDPAQNILKGGSLDWFTVRHWVRVSGAEFSAAVVPVNAPLVSRGHHRGTWPKKFTPKSATVFSYVMNNYWHTNFFRVQAGKYTFRYILTSGQHLSPVALARLGRASMTPMEVRQVISNDKNGNPRGTFRQPLKVFSASAPPTSSWKIGRWRRTGAARFCGLLKWAGETSPPRSPSRCSASNALGKPTRLKRSLSRYQFRGIP